MSLDINPHYPNALVNRGIYYFTNQMEEFARIDLKNAIKYGGSVPKSILKMEFMK
jgi:hypothetical protein